MITKINVHSLYNDYSNNSSHSKDQMVLLCQQHDNTALWIPHPGDRGGVKLVYHIHTFTYIKKLYL